ncbi:MAG: hypothetical protein ABIO17_08880 [Pseudoxanthomonas sp.]
MSAPLTLPTGMLSALEQAYATPSRAYHHFGHVQEVLHRFAEITVGPGWSQPAEVYLAVLYHDAIHDAARRDNEARSADMAMAEIACWLPEAGIDTVRVAELINLTARHGQLSVDDLGDDDGFALDACHFLDCDMAILGAAPEAFDAYDQGIAEEYRGQLPGFLFRLNRRRFLKGLLGRKRIYLSEWFHQRYDAQARDNLVRVLGTQA